MKLYILIILFLSVHLNTRNNSPDKSYEESLEIFDRLNNFETVVQNQDFIISHKSTIPDLVIWNKTFNKNECFEEGDLSKSNPFPRYKFFLHLKNSNRKKRKDNTSNTSNTSDKDDISMDKINLKEDNSIKEKKNEYEIEDQSKDIKMNISSQSNKIKY